MGATESIQHDPNTSAEKWDLEDSGYPHMPLPQGGYRRSTPAVKLGRLKDNSVQPAGGLALQLGVQKLVSKLQKLYAKWKKPDV